MQIKNQEIIIMSQAMQQQLKELDEKLNQIKEYL
jgi:hypothetical protein